MSKEKFKDMLNKGLGKNVTIGEPLVTKVHLLNSLNYLDVLLRKILIKDNITKTQFIESVTKYNDDIGIHPANTSNAIGNLRKSILTGNISFKKFLEVLRIFKYRITDIKISIVNDKNEEYEISLK